MTLQEAFDRTYAKLKHAQIPAARLDAEYLVAGAARIPRLKLVLEKARTLTSKGEQLLHQWTQERLERRPLSYVFGEQPFFNLRLRVNTSVLVPRPETELLVEEACRFLDSRPNAVAADVGTGSGNIAISLAKHDQVSRVHGVDISSAALGVARENALRHSPLKPIEWHLGDLLLPLIQQGIRADLIVANLPYIKTAVLPSLSPEVRWEPALALDGGPDGLAYIKPVIEQAEAVLKPNGLLLLEIGYDQGPAVIHFLETRKGWTAMKLQRDLAGLDRMVHATKGALIGSLND